MKERKVLQYLCHRPICIDELLDLQAGQFRNRALFILLLLCHIQQMAASVAYLSRRKSLRKISQQTKTEDFQHNLNLNLLPPLRCHAIAYIYISGCELTKEPKTGKKNPLPKDQPGQWASIRAQVIGRVTQVADDLLGQDPLLSMQDHSFGSISLTVALPARSGRRGTGRVLCRSERKIDSNWYDDLIIGQTSNGSIMPYQSLAVQINQR